MYETYIAPHLKAGDTLAFAHGFNIHYGYTESELLDLLNMERSTFYDRKREAILLLGVSLWGYAIPCFKGIFNMKGADESDDIPDFFK